MASTTFTDNVTPVISSWLNDVNTATYATLQNGTGTVLVPWKQVNGTAGAPAYSFASDPTLGIYRVSSGVLGFSAGGVVQAVIGATEFQLSSGLLLDWNGDTVLQRDASDTLALKRAANAQAFRIYGNTTGPKYLSLSHNGTDGVIDTSAASGVLQIGQTNATGTNLKNITISGSADVTKKLSLNIDGITTGTTRTLTVQDANDTLVGRATTDTLTNKTFAVASNTLNMAPITNALVADVVMAVAGTYYDGPSVAQGTAGTWFVSGQLTFFQNGGAANVAAKLWDGTTVIASVQLSNAAGLAIMIPFAGIITSPAGNLRISVNNLTNVNGVIRYNTSGLNKDSVITAIRIA